MKYVPALAAVFEQNITNQETGIVEYNGNELTSFTIYLDDHIAAGKLLRAILTLKAQPVSTASFLNELQACAWVDGQPVIPTGKSHPVSELALGGGEVILNLDITPILRDALEAGYSEQTIVVGTIASDSVGGMNTLNLSEEGGIWASFTLHLSGM